MSVHCRAGTCVLEPQGELDIATAPELEREMVRALARVETVAIDLGGATFVDLVGARAICRCAEMAEAAGANFSVDHAQPQARRVFELCGLLDCLSGGPVER